MRLITPSDEKYHDVVKIEDDSHYEIDCQKLTPEEAVVCPFDPDMHVKPNEDGTVTVIKKAYSNPIIRQPSLK